MSHDTIPSHPEPEEKRVPLIDGIGEAIFAIRWPLAMMYLLMWVTVVSYVIWFAQEVFSFWVALYDDPPHHFGVGPWHPHILHHNAEDFILWTLGLIDASMVANLIVMIAVGGYSTFVKEYDVQSLKGRPRWMNRLDSNTLKIKMAVSLIGITSILILRTSMEYNTLVRSMIESLTTARVPGKPPETGDGVIGYDPRILWLMGFNVVQQIAVHIAFIATAFGFTWVAKLMHGHTPAPGAHDASGGSHAPQEAAH